jgi:hypothetical protein
MFFSQKSGNHMCKNVWKAAGREIREKSFPHLLPRGPNLSAHAKHLYSAYKNHWLIYLTSEGENCLKFQKQQQFSAHGWLEALRRILDKIHCLCDSWWDWIQAMERTRYRGQRSACHILSRVSLPTGLQLQRTEVSLPHPLLGQLLTGLQLQRTEVTLPHPL